MDDDINNEENDKKDDKVNEQNDTSSRRRMHKQRTCLLPQKDVYKSAQQLDFTYVSIKNTKRIFNLRNKMLLYKYCSFRTAEQIKVVIKPWIRIDGVLNRKVLDRMLGAILSYCMLHPGLTMTKVQSRFVPVLQPFHTRELLEVRYPD